jgi:hypothetical protein
MRSSASWLAPFASVPGIAARAGSWHNWSTFSVGQDDEVNSCTDNQSDWFFSRSASCWAQAQPSRQNFDDAPSDARQSSGAVATGATSTLTNSGTNAV